MTTCYIICMYATKLIEYHMHDYFKFFFIRGTDIQKITRFICLNTMHTLKEHMNTNLKNNLRTRRFNWHMWWATWITLLCIKSEDAFFEAMYNNMLIHSYTIMGGKKQDLWKDAPALASWEKKWRISVPCIILASILTYINTSICYIANQNDD